MQSPVENVCRSCDCSCCPSRAARHAGSAPPGAGCRARARARGSAAPGDRTGCARAGCPIAESGRHVRRVRTPAGQEGCTARGAAAQGTQGRGAYPAPQARRHEQARRAAAGHNLSPSRPPRAARVQAAPRLVQHRGGRRTAPGSAADATHLDRRSLGPLLAPAPRRGRAATASIAGRRPAHSSNVHRDRARAVGRVAVDVSTPVPKIYFPRFLKGVTFSVETVIHII